MPLLKHNEITLRQVENYINSGKNCCVVNPCGSGKTSIIAELIKDYPDSTFLIITKQKNAEAYYNSKSEIFSSSRVKIVTFNTMHNDVKRNKTSNYQYQYYVVDEAHYLGADMWGDSFRKLVAEFHPLLIGLTATPKRYDQRESDLDIVGQYFDSNYAGNFTSQDLQRKGVFVEPKYMLSFYNLDKVVEQQKVKIMLADIEEKQKEKLFAKLDRIQEKWEADSTPQIVLRENLPKYLYKEKCNRILVYIANMAELQSKKKFLDKQFSSIFPEKKILSYVYTYKSTEQTLNDFLTEDNTDIKVLYSIDKIMETVHIDDLRIAIMLRPSASDRIITQQFGRLNSINNKNQPIIFDMVDNLSKLSDFGSHRVSYSHETENSNKKIYKTHSLNLPHFTYYIDVFDKIDKEIKATKHYAYRGFEGTFKEICFVFSVDEEDLQNLMKTMPFERAIELAKRNGIRIPQCDEESKELTQMTDEQRHFADEHLHLVNNFVQSRNIQNEDLLQDLYCAYFAAVVKTSSQTYEKEYLRVQRVITSFRAAYLRLCKRYFAAEDMKENMFVPETEETAMQVFNNYWRDATQRHNLEQLGEELQAIIQKFPERDQRVLHMLFGFYDAPKTSKEIGKSMGVTPKRINQITRSALSRCKYHICRRKLRKTYVECF